MLLKENDLYKFNNESNWLYKFFQNYLKLNFVKILYLYKSNKTH